MTFTEAAIEVLRREGKPLHFKKIAEIAIRESLLDHVGKIPEEIMGGQLAAHCRLPRSERQVIPVQPGTFALVEWGLDEDPHGLENLIEPPPESEIPYRGRERDPIPSKEMARSLGRESGRVRRREEGEERRGRRFPPPAEVAYEILAGAERPLTLKEVAVLGAERLLMPDAFVRETSSLAAALQEDNRRRESGGRKPLFALDGEMVTLAAQPGPGERVVPVAPRPTAPGDLSRTALAALRRRIRECDGPTVEHIALLMLEQMGLRELKVAKRGREHVVYTGRKRMGLSDVRHCIRILRSGGEVGRRDVVDTRRDLGHYGSQIGMVITAGDAAREARGEAGAAGQLPVVLVCGEALSETLTEMGIGCRPVVVPEIDESFFKSAAEAASQEEAARKARREEREHREARREARAPQPAAAENETAVAAEAQAVGASTPPPETEAVRVPAASGEGLPSPEMGMAMPERDDEDEDVEEEPGTADAAPAGGVPREGEPGGRRRRRRRRRRGGRGRGERREVVAAPASGGHGMASSGIVPVAAPEPGAPARESRASGEPPAAAPAEAPATAPEPERAPPAPEPGPPGDHGTA